MATDSSVQSKVIRRKVIITDNVWRPAGPYSHAVVVGKKVYVTGCVGLSPLDGQLAPGGIEAETHQALKNVGNILKAAGTSYQNDSHCCTALNFACNLFRTNYRPMQCLASDEVVKATLFLTDIADWPTVNDIYKQYFTDHFPARTAVQVQALPRGAHIEIECKAILGTIVDE